MSINPIIIIIANISTITITITVTITVTIIIIIVAVTVVGTTHRRGSGLAELEGGDDVDLTEATRDGPS